MIAGYYFNCINDHQEYFMCFSTCRLYTSTLALHYTDRQTCVTVYVSPETIHVCIWYFLRNVLNYGLNKTTGHVFLMNLIFNDNVSINNTKFCDIRVMCNFVNCYVKVKKPIENNNCIYIYKYIIGY